MAAAGSEFEIFGPKTGSDSKFEIFQRKSTSRFEIEIFQRKYGSGFKFEIFQRDTDIDSKFEIFQRNTKLGFKFEIFQRASTPRYLLTVRFSFRTKTRSAVKWKASAGALAVAPHIAAGSVRTVNASVLPVICQCFSADRDRMTVRRRTASQKGTEACKRTICRTAGRNRPQRQI